MKLLLVEESIYLNPTLFASLQGAGYQVERSSGLDATLSSIQDSKYQVVLLDLSEQSSAGLELLYGIGQLNSVAHILVLARKDNIGECIRGLDLGADDYLLMPYTDEELFSRIQALSFRKRRAENPLLRWRDLTLDTAACRLSREGLNIYLTPTEFHILEYLLRHQGQVFSHQKILLVIYQKNSSASKNTLEAHISTLRKKIRKHGRADPIKTRRGFGYTIPAE